MEHLDKQNRVSELKKHINAIHSTNNLSLLQRKLFNALLYYAYVDLPHKATFTIPVRKLCSMIGYNSNDQAKLKKALVGLISTTIEWNVIEYASPESEKWRASSALAAAKIEDGICEYEYSTIMRELLHHPEVYGRINMDLLAKFNSNYGLALYENCIRYQGLQYTPWYPLSTFRKLMGVLGDKYIGFNHFKKRVLNIAIDEVNHYSPLQIEPEIIRCNKKVTSIRFRLKGNTETLPNYKPSQTENGDEGLLLDKMMNIFSLSPTTIQDLFLKYDLEYVKEKVEMIISSENYRLGKIKGLAGYLIAALTKDYQPAKSSKEVIEKNKSIEKENMSAVQEEEERISGLYNDYVSMLTTKYFDSLDKEDQQSLTDDFIKDMKKTSPFVLKWIDKHGFEHGAVKAIFEKFIRNIRKEKIGYIMSIQEYSQNL